MCEIVLHSGGLFRNAFVTRNHYSSTVEGYAACQRRLQARITNQARPGHAAAAAAARYGCARSKPEYSSVVSIYVLYSISNRCARAQPSIASRSMGRTEQTTDRPPDV